MAAPPSNASPQPVRPNTIGGHLRRIGWPTRILLVIASTFLILGTAGGILGGNSGATRERAVSPPGESSSGGTAALPRLGLDTSPSGGADRLDDSESPTAGGDSADQRSPLLSPVAQGLGLSFLAAFAVGVASRVFLRLALAAAGVAVLMLLGLDRSGLVDVHWTLLEEQSGGLTGWLAQQTESLRAFMTGSLPSGAAAATGFFLGFRRR